MDEIIEYCANKNCEKKQCPRNLNGFWGMYVKIRNDFDCETELNLIEKD